MKPRVITGFGVASAIGVERGPFLEALRTGARWSDAPGSPETFDPSAIDLPAGLVRVAEVRGFDPAKYLGDKGLRILDRLTKLLVVTARLALHDAGLKQDGAWVTSPGGGRPWPERVGLVASNAYGSLEAITELHRVALLEDARYINPSRFPLTVSNSAAGYVSIWEDLRALNVSVSDGNCGALDAASCADMLLESSRADALLVGGAEAMSEALFLAFHRLGAGRARVVHAGDVASEGPSLGEGAALMVIETQEAAAARGAESLAEIIGYGTSFAAPDGDAALVHASPEAMQRAIIAALADASVSPSDVDVVVSGVSGLRIFDEAELLAIHAAIDAKVCVVAPKLALGETLGAGGAMAMLAAIAVMDDTRDERAPARSHVVSGAFRARTRTAVVTSLGYYGNASALVMRAPPR